MPLDLNHIQRQLINKLSLYFQVFNTDNCTVDNTNRIIKIVENRVYGKQGMSGFEVGIDKSDISVGLNRSIAQYYADKLTANRSMSLLILTAPLLFIGIILLIASGCARSVTKLFQKDSCARDVVIYYHYSYLKGLIEDLYPNKSKYYVSCSKHLYMPEDLAFIVKVIFCKPKIIFMPRFLFNLVKWVGIYSYLSRIAREDIVAFMDSSFISSLMTSFLNLKGIRHVNHMHGEIFYHPRWSFSRFDEFYVYSSYWRDMLRRLNCDAKFKVHYTKKFKVLRDIRKLNMRDVNTTLVLHSQILKPRTLESNRLIKYLEGLNRNHRVLIRYHPNEKSAGLVYYDYLKECLGSKVCIQEDPYMKHKIEESISSVSTVVGQTSMALFEAWIAGCNVVYVSCVYDLANRYQNVRVRFLDI